MGWFRRKKGDDATQGRTAPTVPLESFVPILHRALNLALDYQTIPLLVHFTNNDDFQSGDPQRVMPALQAVRKEALDELKKLHEAVAALFAVRPSEPGLSDLHQAAQYYTNAMLQYHDVSNAAFFALITSNNKREVQKLQQQKGELEEVVNAMKKNFQEQIRALCSANRDLYDRLDLADHGLTWLDPEELAD